MGLETWGAWLGFEWMVRAGQGRPYGSTGLLGPSLSVVVVKCQAMPSEKGAGARVQWVILFLTRPFSLDKDHQLTMRDCVRACPPARPSMSTLGIHVPLLFQGSSAESALHCMQEL